MTQVITPNRYIQKETAIMTTRTQETLITVGLVTVVGYAFFSVSHTFAMGTDGRSNACRTFHTFSSQKADDKWAETDGLLCQIDKPAAKSHDSIPATSDIPGTSVLIRLPDDTTMTVDVPTVIVDTPAETPVVDVPADDVPEVTPPAADDNLGNPGNTKDVGHAGENPNGQGTMDDDNAGGNGNGEHGNQGVNH
jgi:hypothetical protein